MIIKNVITVIEEKVGTAHNPLKIISDEFKKDVDTLRHPKYKDLQWELIPNATFKGFEGTFNLWELKGNC